MGFHHRTHLLDLGVEGLHDAGLAGHDRGRGRLHIGGPAQIFGAQDLADLGGLGVHVAPVRPAQGGGDAALGQPGGAVGIGCCGQQLERVGGVQVGERLQRGGEEVP